jgi:hypothetical protein
LHDLTKGCCGPRRAEDVAGKCRAWMMPSGKAKKRLDLFRSFQPLIREIGCQGYVAVFYFGREAVATGVQAEAQPLGFRSGLRRGDTGGKSGAVGFSGSRWARITHKVMSDNIKEVTESRAPRTSG